MVCNADSLYTCYTKKGGGYDGLDAGCFGGTGDTVVVLELLDLEGGLNGWLLLRRQLMIVDTITGTTF